MKDEGIGIPADMQEKIFERFYRIDNSDRRLVGGAGLGLALVREIVVAHTATCLGGELPRQGEHVLLSGSRGQGSRVFPRTPPPSHPPRCRQEPFLPVGPPGNTR